jgi:3-dehydroquinate synthase II
MKELIIDARPYNKEIITTALESGVKKIIVEKGKTEEVHKLGKIQTIAEDGDLVIGKDFIEMKLSSEKDEEAIVEKSKEAIVVVKTSSWKIIPLENLVSKSDNIYAYSDAKEAKAVLKPNDIQELIDVAKLINSNGDKVDLELAEITNVKSLSNGDRACVDTCSMMVSGQGMLVGNSSNFLFLVNSETEKSEYCATRPFRVNAGAIHAYVLMPENKTKYLSEIKSGDEVLIVNEKGQTKTAIVGRNKIEERPMMLIEATINGKTSGVVLQNAETIRLVVGKNKTVSVTELKKGDKVLVRVDNTGRHFGKAIKEKLNE